MNLVSPIPHLYINCSEDWVEVGFQGVDPSTDFRGTGQLGYLNLMYLVSQHLQTAKHLLQIARDKKTEYFFACASINITFNLKKLLTNKALAEYLGKMRTEDGVFQRFNEVFVKVLEEFIGYWQQHPDSNSFMNFNTVLVTNIYL